jgi:hypothetical protein
MKRLFSLTIVVLTVAAGAASIASSDQQVTSRPGEMTENRVWVENRSAGEAVAVNLQAASLQSPLKVNVVAPDGSPIVGLRVQMSASQWDYRTLTVTSPEDAARALGQAGSEGWETTGIAWPLGTSTRLLMKRPH